jgi:transposase InsO family protein
MLWPTPVMGHCGSSRSCTCAGCKSPRATCVASGSAVPCSPSMIGCSGWRRAAAERKIELSDDQVRLLEPFSPEFRERNIEAPHTGSLVAVDTFFVGALKGVGKVYLQTVVDCHSPYAWARLYTSKLPITAVQLINNHVLPTFEAAGAKIAAVLFDSGREFYGRLDRHPYELFLQLEEIEHRTTKVKRPQSTDGIVERLHRTLLDEHFRWRDAELRSKPSRRCSPFSTPISSTTISAGPTEAAA